MAPTERSRPPWPVLAIAAGAGGVWGVLTLLGQHWLPGSWNQLADSSSMWVVGSFIAGAWCGSRRTGVAAVAGLAVVAGELAGYYAAAATQGVPHTQSSITFWVVMGLVGGPLLGAAGSWWRDPERRRHVLGVAMLGGTFAGEGIFFLNDFYLEPLRRGWVYHGSVNYPLVAGVALAVGVAVPIVLARATRERLAGVISAGAVAVVFAFLYGSVADIVADRLIVVVGM